MAKKEILELVPEQIEEVDEDYSQFDGFLYTIPGGIPNLSEKKFYYHFDVYEGLSFIDDRTQIELWFTSDELYPKYRLDISLSGKTLERFYFENFRALNHFLNTNGFYNLLILSQE